MYTCSVFMCFSHSFDSYSAPQWSLPRPSSSFQHRRSVFIHAIPRPRRGPRPPSARGFYRVAARLRRDQAVLSSTSEACLYTRFRDLAAGRARQVRAVFIALLHASAAIKQFLSSTGEACLYTRFRDLAA
ncbi:MAG: hypothetical protein ACLS9E_14225, partial [Acutalibacteraceae bacterium]